jgi:type II secretion system protein I
MIARAGFTLVEVLVALMIVAIGLSALMVAVSGTARTSGYLRDKTSRSGSRSIGSPKCV